MAPEVVLTMRPYPAARMCGHAARDIQMWPMRWTAITFSRCEGSISSKSDTTPMPALLTRMSTRPQVSIAVWITARGAGLLGHAVEVGDRFPARRRDLGDDGIGVRGDGAAAIRTHTQIIDDDLGAARRQEHGVRATQAGIATGTGHDRDLPVEPHRAHVPSFVAGASGYGCETASEPDARPDPTTVGTALRSDDAALRSRPRRPGPLLPRRAA